jgi:nucleoside-diphosphate-sugar epimerase
VHLATGGGASWEEVERAMVAGTRALGELCLAEKVERLIYVSSIAALYLGPDCGTEVVEDDFPTDPRPEQRALYARGKALAERELVRLFREKGLPVTIVRPGVVLGRGTPLQHSGLGLWVRDNHCVGWGRGNRPLPLVLVEDVADALARLAAHAGSQLDGKTLNLAARGPWTAAELVLALRRATGRDFHFHPRPLALSQAMEIGKWLVKKAGGRRDAFPSYRDLKSRSLHPPFSARTAREVLGWRPCEEREEFLKRMLPETMASA